MAIIKRALTCVLNNMKQGKALFIIVLYITAKDTRVKKCSLNYIYHASTSVEFYNTSIFGTCDDIGIFTGHVFIADKVLIFV